MVLILSNAKIIYPYARNQNSALSNYQDTVCINGEYKEVKNHYIKSSKSYRANQDLGYIYFPTVGKEGLIVQGNIADTSNAAMNKGVVHDPTTVMPGEKGNTVFFGHRELFMKNVEDLKKGDPILLNVGGNTFIYEITGFDIIYPNDLNKVFKTNKSNNTLTLYTCYPLQAWATYNQRYVVHAKEVSSYDCSDL